MNAQDRFLIRHNASGNESESDDARVESLRPSRDLCAFCTITKTVQLE